MSICITMLTTALGCNFAFQTLHSPFLPQLHGNPFSSLFFCGPATLWNEQKSHLAEELWRVVEINILEHHQWQPWCWGETLCSVTPAQGKGRKIKGLLVGTDGNPWASCRREGCCSAGSFMPLSMKCHFQEQFCEAVYLFPSTWEGPLPFWPWQGTGNHWSQGSDCHSFLSSLPCFGV